MASQDSAYSAVIATVVAYQLILIAVGFVSKERTRDSEDYFVGGRRLPPWIASLSASASSSSAWTLLGVSGAAYLWGLSAIWLIPGCVGGFAFNWYVLAPGLHRFSHQHRPVTITDALSIGISPRGRVWIRLLCTIFVVSSLCVYIAVQFQGAGKLFADMLGWDLELAIVLGAGIVIFYTLLGGFWAASLSDAVQGIMMAAASIVLPLVAFYEVGGPVELGAAMQRASPNDVGLTGESVGAAGVGFVFGLLGIGLGYPGQPHVANRFLALREGSDAVRTARRYALAWALVIYPGMIVVGLCGRVLFPELADAERVLFVASYQLLPPVVAGIILAAVLSAVMSTVDSQLLVVASSLTHDLPRKSGTTLRQVRIAVLLVSTMAVLIALLSPAEIFSRVLFAWNALGAAFGPVLLVRVWKGEVGARATILAMTIGFGSAVAFALAPPFAGKSFERWIPFTLALVVAWLGARGRHHDA